MLPLAEPIEVRRLGRVEYSDGLRLQEIWAEAVRTGQAPDAFFLLEHGPVLTLGRAPGGMANVLASPETLAGKEVEIHPTSRGGDVTYHGPGQVVGYPIFNLAASPERKDVRRHVRACEEIMIRTAADFGVRATREEKLTGVWVGRNKIGAIGVRVARWVTSHGFAFNVNTDLSYFDLIVPCGIPDRGVTSLARETGRQVSMAEVEDRLEAHTGEVFGRDLSRRDVAITTVAVVVKRLSRSRPRAAGAGAGAAGERSGQAEFLCLKRTAAKGGFWQVVTGRIESGETPAVAAARELLEETGFAVAPKPLHYEHAFALENPPALGLTAPALAREVVFLAEVPAGAASRLAPEEHDEHCWLSPDKAAERVMHAGHRRAIRLASSSK